MMIDEDDDGDDYKDDISTIWNCTSYKSHIDVSDDDDACEAQPRYSGWGCAVSSKMAAIGSRWHTETPLSYTADQLQLLAISYLPKIVHFSLRRKKLKCCISWTNYKKPHPHPPSVQPPVWVHIYAQPIHLRQPGNEFDDCDNHADYWCHITQSLPRKHEQPFWCSQVWVQTTC